MIKLQMCSMVIDGVETYDVKEFINGMANTEIGQSNQELVQFKFISIYQVRGTKYLLLIDN
jgi:hypothetical protein